MPYWKGMKSMTSSKEKNIRFWRMSKNRIISRSVAARNVKLSANYSSKCNELFSHRQYRRHFLYHFICTGHSLGVQPINSLFNSANSNARGSQLCSISVFKSWRTLHNTWTASARVCGARWTSFGIALSNDFEMMCCTSTLRFRICRRLTVLTFSAAKRVFWHGLNAWRLTTPRSGVCLTFLFITSIHCILCASRYFSSLNVRAGHGWKSRHCSRTAIGERNRK